MLSTLSALHFSISGSTLAMLFRVRNALDRRKQKAPPEGSADCQKTFGRCRRARKPFDFASKIGDMRGDFRTILLAKSFPYTKERPGGPFKPDQRRSAKLEKVPKALFRHTEAPPGGERDVD